MTSLNRYYQRRLERCEDDRPSGKQMVIKVKRPQKKTMNWNGLAPTRKELTAK